MKERKERKEKIFDVDEFQKKYYPALQSRRFDNETAGKFIDHQKVLLHITRSLIRFV